MTEQTTIRELTAIARDWGPLWSIAALFVIYQIAQTIHFKRKRSKYNQYDKQRDNEIERLREARGEILKEISDLKLKHSEQMGDFRVELEKRTTYEWFEEKVLPKIDQLTTSVIEFKTTMELLIKQGGGK